MDQLDDSQTHDTPVWPIFGDLMAGLVGVFVLLLVWTLGMQVELSQSLDLEIEKREAEEQRRYVLEEALAAPLAAGRITLRDGKIGISGSVLFATNSAELQREGRELLSTLVSPLKLYLGDHDERLMVSGFTDDRPIHDDHLHFDDNWDLSAKRALTVTRALIEDGMPSALVFAAAFGAQQPLATNNNREGRAQNRRVEMAPVPRSNANKPSIAPHE